MKMNAWLVTYRADTETGRVEVELPEQYDGNPYGDTVPFCVGSNQSLLVMEE